MALTVEKRGERREVINLGRDVAQIIKKNRTKTSLLVMGTFLTRPPRHRRLCWIGRGCKEFRWDLVMSFKGQTNSALLKYSSKVCPHAFHNLFSYPHLIVQRKHCTVVSGTCSCGMTECLSRGTSFMLVPVSLANHSLLS